MWRRFCGPCGTKVENTVCFRGRIQKLGGQNVSRVPQKVLASLLDSKFNIDYDFAIKHGPIQSDETKL